MAIERKSPDALLVSTNLTGSITVIVDDPNLSEGDWLSATDETLDTVARVSFPSPSGNPTAGPGFQEFKFLSRLTSSASPCAYSVDLYEDGSLVGNLDSGTITSTTGQLITAVWDAADLGTADGSLVEAQITITANVDTTGEIGAIEWNVTYTPSGAADSVRESCLQSFESQVSAITTANGYDINITTVERARMFFEMTSGVYASIIDGEETTERRMNKNYQNMLVSCQLHADAGSTNRSTQANKMLAAIKKGILSADTTQGGYAERTYLESSEIKYPDDDDSTIVHVNASFRIVYKEVVSDPYSMS